VMRAVGRRLASSQPVCGQPAEARESRRCASDQLGAVTTVESTNGCAWSCAAPVPARVAVLENPAVCHAVQELLSVLVAPKYEKRVSAAPGPPVVSNSRSLIPQPFCNARAASA
jgi:hypothetical protein